MAGNRTPEEGWRRRPIGGEVSELACLKIMEIIDDNQSTSAQMRMVGAICLMLENG